MRLRPNRSLEFLNQGAARPPTLPRAVRSIAHGEFMNFSTTLGSFCLGMMLAGFTAGCVTAPAPTDGVYSAYRVGDRASILFDEVVTTVRSSEWPNVPLNLHVGIGVIANPQKVTTGDPYEVQDIVRRMEPRIASAVAKFLSTRQQIAASEHSQLQEQIERVAHAAFIESFKRWSKASDYEVQTVVTAFYFTDLSVGRTPAPRRWGWQ